MADPCDLVKNEYIGDGTTYLFPFTFEYDKQSEIQVSLFDPTTEYFIPIDRNLFTFANATTVSLNTIPAPLVTRTGEPRTNIRISRITDISSMASSFYPGSAIRAQDLNDNFGQLQSALQETSCTLSDINSIIEGGGSKGVAPTTRFNTTATNGQTVVIVNPAFSPGQEIVFINGAEQTKDIDYRVVSSSQVVFTQPLLSGDVIDIISYNNIQLVEVSTEFDTIPYSRQAFTSTAGQTIYTCSPKYTPEKENVYLNGALLTRNVDYTAYDGVTVTLTMPALVGDVVEVHCGNYYATGVEVPTTGTLKYTYPGGAKQPVQQRLEQYVSVKDFGAKGNGVNDDTSAIQAALDTLPGSVFVPSGNYKISSSINIKGNTSLVGAGKEETKFIVDPSATAFNTNTRAWVSKAGPAPTAIPSLSTNYGKSAWSITFTGNHGLIAGDLILFMGTVAGGFNGFRTNYFKGEYNTVQEVVSPTEIYLTHATLDTYDTADTEMYKCSYTGGSLKDFSVIGNGYSNTIELALKNTQGCSVENVYVTGSTNTCMSVIQSYDTDIKKTTCFQNEPVGSTSYGLNIANSQLTRIQGRFKAARHAIAHGGEIEFGIPCRYSVTYNSFLETDMLGNAPAWDCHGNSEYITLTDSFITGGISVGGNHSLVSGCQITSGQVQASSFCQYAELNGLDHILTDCYIYSGYNNPNFGVIDFGGNSQVFNANTVEGGTISITNCVLDFPAHTGFGITVRNRGSLTDYNIVVDNVDIRMPNQDASFAAVRVDTVSGNTPRSIQVTRVTPGPINNQPLYISAAEINTPIRQDSVSGIDTFSIAEGDTSLVDSPQSLPFKYARKPSMLVSGESLYDSDGTNWVVQNFLNYPNSSQYRFTLRSTGGAAINDFDTRVHWTASLQDF